SCADDFLTFKSVVKAIAARNGLFASFMPKPLAAAPGSGLHINISLAKNGLNIFGSRSSQAIDQSWVANSFIAGILAKAPEITLFLNPLCNSYDRLGSFSAPRYVSWSHQNRSQLVRIPAASGDRIRMELRSPDPAVNPYLAFALILAAGLSGIEQKLNLPPAVDLDLYTLDPTAAEALTALPASLEEAIALAHGSELVRDVIGEELLSDYIAFKRKEAAAFAAAEDRQAFYRQHYFHRI
ncbi:MAG: hypothetical protein WBK98_05350, partial [Limnochordia bacterium]